MNLGVISSRLHLGLLMVASLLVALALWGCARAPADAQSKPGPAPTGMVWIPGGEFSMGSRDPRGEFCGGLEAMDDARPIHRVKVDGFWMDLTEVTNAEFARFVAATGYVTVAERPLDPGEFPGVSADKLVPGSLVFTPPNKAVPLNNALYWWRYVPGANWRHPEGPGSNLTGRENFPVVHVTFEDAVTYAKWADKQLPTEAQWEFAARGGRAGALYPWGDTFEPDGRSMANTFQGEFPHRNTGADGYMGAAPVASYPPNDYGLHDMAGNVWEWCADWYHPDVYGRRSPDKLVHNPVGVTEQESYDPAEPGLAKRVQRGGSFLCTDQYCTRYMVGSRGKGDPQTSSNHVGFRCVRNL